jgi:uncharacterized protein (UPF0332 family)
MSLATWQTNGWLEVHQSSRQEIADLLKVVERDLHDSKATDVSADWRSNIAYNAALQAAKAALHASGYRAARGANSHYRTIQSLSLTIGLDAKSIRTLDAVRKRRNTAEYDQAGVTSDTEAGDIRTLATALRDKLVAWLRTDHPELLNDEGAD